MIFGKSRMNAKTSEKWAFKKYLTFLKWKCFYVSKGLTDGIAL